MNPYLILKPEMRNYADSIDKALAENNFEVASRHPINDWGSLASRLYDLQVSEDRDFASNLSTYIWLTKRLFGNSAVAFILNGSAEMENLARLNEMKKRFREEIIGSGDNAFRLFVDLDKVKPVAPAYSGTLGNLAVEGQPQGFYGRWDDFFFKYIHVPDPNHKSLEKELAVLESEGILSSEISKEGWETMKELQTLKCPAEYLLRK